MWVRGLKLPMQSGKLMVIKSHPMWVRGLKPGYGIVGACSAGRTLCGCVD